jgi:hypothetical protein
MKPLGEAMLRVADEVIRYEKLLAERQAEIERLRELLRGPDPHYDLARENGVLRAERDDAVKTGNAFANESMKLRAERDELLAALQEIEFHGGPAADYARAAIAKAAGRE